MSFSENLVPGEETRQKEMHGTDTTKIDKPVDGTTVGNTPQDLINNPENDKDKKKSDMPVRSIEEMQKFVDT